MGAIELPDNPVYAFVPVTDPDTGLQQIRIVIDGMDIAIGTSLVVLDIEQAMVVADRLNRPLGWTRAGWTAFAAERLSAGGCDPDRSAGPPRDERAWRNRRSSRHPPTRPCRVGADRAVAGDPALTPSTPISTPTGRRSGVREELAPGERRGGLEEGPSAGCPRRSQRRRTCPNSTSPTPRPRPRPTC